MFTIALILYLFSAIELLLSVGRDVKDSIGTKIFDDKDSDERIASMHKSNWHFLKFVLALIAASWIVIYC